MVSSQNGLGHVSGHEEALVRVCCAGGGVASPSLSLGRSRVAGERAESRRKIGGGGLVVTAPARGRDVSTAAMTENLKDLMLDDGGLDKVRYTCLRGTLVLSGVVFVFGNWLSS